jgi:hypothetical protein
MITDHMIYILYMAIAFLLPLVPAYFLYRSLPSKAVVHGPFKGLNVQLSGAFAGYFLLVLIMQGFVLLRPKPPDVERYRVEGQVKDVPQEIVDDLVNRIAVRPDGRVSYGDGHFSVEILARRDSITGDQIIPSLIIQREGYESATVPLDKPTPEYVVEHSRGLIKVKTSIVLRKKYDKQPYKGDE